MKTNTNSTAVYTDTTAPVYTDPMYRYKVQRGYGVTETYEWGAVTRTGKIRSMSAMRKMIERYWAKRERVAVVVSVEYIGRQLSWGGE